MANVFGKLTAASTGTTTASISTTNTDLSTTLAKDPGTETSCTILPILAAFDSSLVNQVFHGGTRDLARSALSPLCKMPYLRFDKAVKAVCHILDTIDTCSSRLIPISGPARQLSMDHRWRSYSGITKLTGGTMGLYACWDPRMSTTHYGIALMK